jgi:hypothetical protein
MQKRAADAIAVFKRAIQYRPANILSNIAVPNFFTGLGIKIANRSVQPGGAA